MQPNQLRGLSAKTGVIQKRDIRVWQLVRFRVAIYSHVNGERCHGVRVTRRRVRRLGIQLTLRSTRRSLRETVDVFGCKAAPSRIYVWRGFGMSASVAGTRASNYFFPDSMSTRSALRWRACLQRRFSSRHWTHGHRKFTCAADRRRRLKFF